MKQITIFTFAAALLLSACGGADSATERVFALKHTLRNAELPSDVQIAISDSFVVLLSAFFEDGCCRTYSTDGSLEQCGSFGRIGNGEGEFCQPVLTFADGNMFGVNDINEMSLTLVTIEGNGAMSVADRMKAEYKRERNIDDYIPMDRRFTLLPGTGHYVSLFMKDSASMFTLSDSRLKPLCRFGDSPVEGNLSFMGMSNYLNGFMAASGAEFFFAMNELPYLAAYALEGGAMKKKWEKFYRTPHYAVSNDAVRYDKERATGPLFSMCADDRYIYLLYMDGLLSSYDYNDISKSSSDKILVLDHSGEYVAALHCDCRLKKIAVDGKRRKLYGVALMPQCALVEFDLPDDFTDAALWSVAPSSVSQPQPQGSAVCVGDTLPDVVLYDIQGGVHNFSDYRGKNLLLYFWLKECGPCRLALPELKSIAETMSDKLDIVGLCGDAESVWKMATDKEELRWYNLNDLKGGTMDGVCGRFGVCGYPTFFIVSPDGVILDKLQGYRKGDIASFVNENI
jgi:peroxiredoxin